MVTVEPSSTDLDHTEIPPIVASTWETPVVDAHRVQKALELLWGQLRIERGETGGTQGAQSDEYEQMRASTLNLIVLADTTEGAQAVHRTIAELTEFCPSRAAILVTDGPDVAGDDLTIRAAVHEQPRGKTEQPIRYETITVMANRRRDASLVNIASTLLVPELPDFLWWHAPSIASESLFDELVSISDRLIVDTAKLDHISDAFPLLARLGVGPRPASRLSDLAWARLTPWRQIVAQFFDPADARPCLDTIDEIDIEYGGEIGSLPSGMTTGLLMVGWLASRLGWQSPGELVKTREGWRVTLRGGKAGRRREIILRMKATDDPATLGILRSIQINCADPACGAFRVDRVDMQCLTTHSQVGDAPAMTRMVHTRACHPEDLITAELRMFGRDQVYEDALTFAATLLPIGDASE
jgi:glucose-6-phosphate dehydrogenase assembly protein OpcA